MATSKYQSFIDSSSIQGANAPYIEAYYEQFLEDPESVDADWRAYFRLIQDQNAPRETAHSDVVARFERLAREPRRVVAAEAGFDARAAENDLVKVIGLNRNGTQSLVNGGHGILIAGASFETIGGAEAGAGARSAPTGALLVHDELVYGVVLDEDGGLAVLRAREQDAHVAPQDRVRLCRGAARGRSGARTSGRGSRSRCSRIRGPTRRRARSSPTRSRWPCWSCWSG